MHSAPPLMLVFIRTTIWPLAAVLASEPGQRLADRHGRLRGDDGRGRDAAERN
jgi:hypothetical protein